MARTYTLVGRDFVLKCQPRPVRRTVWQLCESRDGGPFEVLAQDGPMTAMEAHAWADGRVGRPLRWQLTRTNSESVFTQAWSATVTDPHDAETEDNENRGRP